LTKPEFRYIYKNCKKKGAKMKGKIIFLLFCMVGCAEWGVGDPCFVEVEKGGKIEVVEEIRGRYVLEFSSKECRAGICISDPNIKRAYCTCQCGGEGSYLKCECPEDYTCMEMITEKGIRANFCVEK
jgi:hypothetical protein